MNYALCIGKNKLQNINIDRDWCDVSLILISYTGLSQIWHHANSCKLKILTLYFLNDFQWEREVQTYVKN